MATEGNQDLQARRQDAANAGQQQQSEEFAERDQQRRSAPEGRTDDEGMRRGGGPGNESRGGQTAGGSYGNVAAIAFRGTALMLDLQLEAARTLWQAQARSASVFGAPDLSQLFRVDDDRARRVFSVGAEQFASSMRHATQMMIALQHEVARVAEQNMIGVGEGLRQQLSELGRQTERGLREITQLSFESLDQVREAGTAVESVEGDGRQQDEGNGSGTGRGRNRSEPPLERRPIPRRHG